MWLYQGCWDKEIVLDYPGGPGDGITSILIIDSRGEDNAMTEVRLE